MKNVFWILFFATYAVIAMLGISREENARREELLKMAALAADHKEWSVVAALETTQDTEKVRELCALPEKRVTADGQPFWLECSLEASFPSLSYRSDDPLTVTYLLSKGHSVPEGVFVNVKAIGSDGKVLFPDPSAKPVKTKPLPRITTQRRLAAL